MYEPPDSCPKITCRARGSRRYPLRQQCSYLIVETWLRVPELGPVSVSGLTFTELKRLVSRVVSERMIGTEIFLSPVALRQISVLVVGEVEKPGNYVLSALSSPIHALYVAGGPSDLGSYRNIKLTKLGGGLSQISMTLV